MPDRVIKQQDWTDEKLRAAGFEQYNRKKQVVMARQLNPKEAPLKIVTREGHELMAYDDYFICYVGDEPKNTLEEYDHWPVEPKIFHETYALWNEKDWQPSPAQQHMMQQGCKPYYKKAAVWAKKLEEDVYIQSLEHEQPIKIKTGEVLAIGAEGEPYSMGDKTFVERYYQETRTRFSWLLRALGLIK